MFPIQLNDLKILKLPVLLWAYLILDANALLAQFEDAGEGATVSHPLVGVLEPWKSIHVACSEQGLIEQLFVKPGDRVQAGSIVAQLDSKLSEIQLDIAAAQAASKGRIETARAEVELLEKKVHSIRQAREKKYSTQSELDRAEAELKISRSRLQSELDGGEILDLQVRKTEELLRQRKVISPIDGVVEKVFKSPGEFVSPNAPEVVRIVDVSKLRASFFLQVEEMDTLKVGSRLEVELSGKVRRNALVEHIAPFADGESGLVEIHVLVDNAEMRVWDARCRLLVSPKNAEATGK